MLLPARSAGRWQRLTLPEGSWATSGLVPMTLRPLRGHLPTLRAGRKADEEVRKPRAMNRPTNLLNPMRENMTGLEFVQAIVDGRLPHNSMADTLGYRIVEAEKGRVAITATPNDKQLNPHGTVHGGLAATMLDSCMGLSIMTLLEK